MEQFKKLLAHVLDNGEWRGNRTAQRSKAVFSYNMSFDLREGFPMVTVKQVPFRSVIAELVGFIRGYKNAADFRSLGTTIWDANANQTPAWLASPYRHGEDDLGRIYGAQWRKWKSGPCAVPTGRQGSRQLGPHSGGRFFRDGGYLANETTSEFKDLTSYLPEVDQLQNLIYALKHNPGDRRHIVTAWNPGELDQMALPPCHILFQCFVSNDGFLDLKMYQRSADIFLGIPFNIASYAALLTLLAHLTGYKPRFLHMDLGDTHLYENQIEGAKECLQRTPLKLPQLVLGCKEDLHIDDLCVSHFALLDYKHHTPIKVEMVV